MHRAAFGSLPDAPMTDSGWTLEEHLAWTAKRADVAGELQRVWISPKAKANMVATEAAV
jgi:hypothetical protein